MIASVGFFAIGDEGIARLDYGPAFVPVVFPPGTSPARRS